MIEKVTSFELKLALLEYFRFKRQFICVDEYAGADIIADTGKEIIEVEIKVDRQDLRRGEEKKASKHQCYQRGRQWDGCHPNKYSFCVPRPLAGVAEEVIEKMNPKYGLIVFDSDEFLRLLDMGYGPYPGNYLLTVKRARKLHDFYEKRQRERIAKRCSSKLIGLMEKQHLENINGREMSEASTL